MALNSLDYQNNKFARESGQTWLRPDYASSITCYRPYESYFYRYYHFFALVIFATACVGVGFGAFFGLKAVFATL